MECLQMSFLVTRSAQRTAKNCSTSRTKRLTFSRSYVSPRTYSRIRRSDNVQFKYAKNSTTRQRAQEGHESRLEVNVPLLSKAIGLRRKIAGMLGYNTWYLLPIIALRSTHVEDRADYITEVKMIKSGTAVEKFLDDLEQKLRPVGLKDKETLLALKKAEHDATGQPFDGEFYIWDYRYYDRIFVEKTLDLDDSLVKEYFPVSVVIPTILEIYQNLLGVKFEEIKDGSTWHPEVQQFAVWAKDAKDESGFIGYCYLDLFPRCMYSVICCAYHALIVSQLQNTRMPQCGRSFQGTIFLMASATSLSPLWLRIWPSRPQTNLL